MILLLRNNPFRNFQSPDMKESPTFQKNRSNSNKNNNSKNAIRSLICIKNMMIKGYLTITAANLLTIPKLIIAKNTITIELIQNYSLLRHTLNNHINNINPLLLIHLLKCSLRIGKIQMKRSLVMLNIIKKHSALISIMISQKTSIIRLQSNTRDYNCHQITAKKAHIIQVIGIAVIILEIMNIKENLK